MVLDAVQANLASCGLPSGAKLLVGVSGGLDSVVLLRVLHAAGYPVEVLHINYQVRGAASENDARFVEALCRALDLACTVERVTLPETNSLQDAARRIRYQRFAAAATARNISWVAVAHHRRDQVETVLLNLFRGSGIEGLTGMPMVRQLDEGHVVKLIRPLLTIDRSELIALARREGWAWREDASNASTKYRRNAIRHTILPAIEAVFGDTVGQHIVQGADILRDYHAEWFAPGMEKLWQEATKATGFGGLVHMDLVQGQRPAIRMALLLQAASTWCGPIAKSFVLGNQLDQLLASQVGRVLPLPHGTVWRERGALVFKRANEVEDRTRAWVVQPNAEAHTSGGTFRLTIQSKRPTSLQGGGAYEEMLDLEQIHGSIQIRYWRDGDRMQPLGMQHTKLISDLLADAKIPSHTRKQRLVVVDDRGIIWLPGVRLSERVKVKPESRRLAKLEWIRAS